MNKQAHCQPTHWLEQLLRQTNYAADSCLKKKFTSLGWCGRRNLYTMDSKTGMLAECLSLAEETWLQQVPKLLPPMMMTGFQRDSHYSWPSSCYSACFLLFQLRSLSGHRQSNLTMSKSWIRLANSQPNMMGFPAYCEVSSFCPSLSSTSTHHYLAAGTIDINEETETSAQHDLKSITTESFLQNIPTCLGVGFCIRRMCPNLLRMTF